MNSIHFDMPNKDRKKLDLATVKKSKCTKVPNRPIVEDFHPIVIEGTGFAEIDEIEFILLTGRHLPDTEVEPLRVTFRVRVDRDREIVLMVTHSDRPPEVS